MVVSKERQCGITFLARCSLSVSLKVLCERDVNVQVVAVSVKVLKGKVLESDIVGVRHGALLFERV